MLPKPKLTTAIATEMTRVYDRLQREKCDLLRAAAPDERKMDEQRAKIGRKAIDALIEMLPPSGSVFPVEDRKRWIDAMAAILIFIYGVDGEIETCIDGDEVRVDVHYDPTRDM